jgi:hypothetical protein
VPAGATATTVPASRAAAAASTRVQPAPKGDATPLKGSVPFPSNPRRSLQRIPGQTGGQGCRAGHRRDCCPVFAAECDRTAGLDPAGRARNLRAARDARATTAKLVRAGVTVGTGTDIWQLPTAVHMELEELVASGLSPAEAIRAATSSAARIIGADNVLGSVEQGKWADLLILDADPLADIRNTRRISAVVQGGRVVDRGAIRGGFTRATPPSGGAESR